MFGHCRLGSAYLQPNRACQRQELLKVQPVVLTIELQRHVVASKSEKNARGHRVEGSQELSRISDAR